MKCKRKIITFRMINILYLKNNITNYKNKLTKYKEKRYMFDA